MYMVFAVVFALIVWVFSALHVYWAYRSPQSFIAVVPVRDGRPLFKPGRFITLFVAFLLFTAGLLALWRAGLLVLPLPEWLGIAGIRVLALVFAVRAVGDFRYVGFFKSVRNSRFARLDNLYYSPLCLLLALLALAVAILAPQG